MVYKITHSSISDGYRKSYSQLEGRSFLLPLTKEESRETNHAPRIDYEAISNMKGAMWHFDYLNACMYMLVNTDEYI